jgi:phosphoglycerate kinase
MEKELNYLGAVLEDPKHPYIAILGGAKISDKIGVVERLLDQADQLLIGGAMANTFFAAAGNNMADSLVEEQSLAFAKDLLEKGKRRLMLPLDLVVADAFSVDAKVQIVTPDAVPDGWRAMDIGPKTIEVFSEAVKGAQLVVWNGPMGVFEFDPFAAGTKGLAKTVAECEGTTIVGGGDSAAAIRQAGLTDQIDHVSTGGGASLELIEGKTLPGVDVLLDKGSK